MDPSSSTNLTATIKISSRSACSPCRGPGPARDTVGGMVPMSPFGRTGHASTRLIFGAAALGAMSQERADATLALVDEVGDQPHRHRRVVRRVRGPAAPVPRHEPAAATSSRPRPGSATAHRGPRRARAFVRANGGRPRRPHPAPQPRRARRVGDVAFAPAAPSQRSLVLATKGSSGSSASRATACASRRCTCAASNGSTSTPSCSPTTGRSCTDDGYRADVERLRAVCVEP